MPDSVLSRDEQTVLLLRRFFAAMRAELQLTAQQGAAIVPSYFLGWIVKHLTESPVADPSELCVTLGIDYACWERLQQLLDSTAGVEMVWKVWPHVTMGDYPPPQGPLASMQVSVLLRWVDGSIMPITMHVAREMAASGVLSEATLGTTLRIQVENVIKILAVGLDTLKDQSEFYGGDHPYEVMMGVLVGMKDRITLETRPYYEKYMRLAQRLIRMPLPPHVLALLDQRRHEVQARQRPADAPPHGGWDL